MHPMGNVRASMSIQARHQLPGLSRGGASDDRTTAILRESAGEFCAELSRDGRLQRISERGLAFLGCEGQGAPDLRLRDVVVAAEHDRLDKACRRCFDGGEDVSVQLQVLRSLLDPVAVALSLHRIGAEVALVVWRDVALVSGLRAALRQSRELDGLTGFAHRDAFAAMVLEAARNADDPSARRLLVIDFAGWPTLKRALGRAASHAAIAQLAVRFAAVLRACAPIADSLQLSRLDDARLAACFDADGPTLDGVLASLGRSMPEPLATDYMSVVPRPRLVVVLLDRIDADRTDGGDPLERAEAALEARLRQIDTAPLQVKLSEFALMRGPVLCKALTGAFINGEFDLAWRPVFALDAGATSGPAANPPGPASLYAFKVELSWIHDAMRVPPDDFMPIAAASGLLDRLAAWAMRVVGASLGQWAAAGTQVRCILPMTREQFAADGLLDALSAGFSATGLRREQLHLEVEAASLAADPEFARRRLGELREAGFSMAVNGIGAIGSAFAEVARWPLALATLDAGCLARVADDPGAGRVAVSLLRLLSALGADVVAAGIDDETQLRWLLGEGAGRDWPCLAMGDALGGAMSATQVGDWLGHPVRPAAAPADADRAGDVAATAGAPP